MAPADDAVPCVSCGAPTPPAEMFGLAPDLRCPPCADALRRHTHPAGVRRLATTFRPTSAHADGRATAAVLAAAVVLFVAQQASPQIAAWILETERVWGYAFPDRFQVTTRHGPWVFVLWAFLHGGIAHLLMNGLALWQIGRWIEWGWGRLTFAGVLVASAVTASAAGWLLTGRPNIGLSGGLFAIDGWLLAQRRHHVVATAIVNRVFLNSLIAGSLLLVVLSEVGGWPISHVGHATGFLWGLAAGFTARSRRPLLGWALLAAASAVVLLLPGYVEPLGWSGRLFRGRG